MGRAKEVKIGDILFEKKGDAITYFKNMLNSYKLNERVSDSDSEFLENALRNHPEYDEKIGVGIDHFIVRSADYDTRCFWVVRTDGTEAKFSYKYCL